MTNLKYASSSTQPSRVLRGGRILLLRPFDSSGKRSILARVQIQLNSRCDNKPLWPSLRNHPDLDAYYDIQPSVRSARKTLSIQLSTCLAYLAYGASAVNVWMQLIKKKVNYSYLIFFFARHYYYSCYLIFGGGGAALILPRLLSFRYDSINHPFRPYSKPIGYPTTQLYL